MANRVIFGVTEPRSADALAELTFPAYRHLLDLEPQPRHAGRLHGSGPVIQPIAVAAVANGVPVGLAVAELPVDTDDEPELLSVYVRPEVRRQGIGTRLIAEICREVADRGHAAIDAVYMTGKPEIVGLEKIFWKLGWGPPDTRMTVLRLTADDFDRLSWMHWTRVPKNYDIVRLAEIEDEAMAELRAIDRNEDWIPEDLRPWDHVGDGYEPNTSMVLKVDGRIVGWVVTHKLSDTMVRYTSSYVHPDLWRRCALLRLWRASFLAMLEAGFTVATLTTHARHPQMVAFIRKHVAPVVSFVAETRGTRKVLHSTAPVADANREP